MPKKQIVGYVVATDTFMSGWGPAAEGRSLIAFEVYSDEDIKHVTANLRARTDMARVRFNLDLPRTNKGDHLSVKDRESAPFFYQPESFRR